MKTLIDAVDVEKTKRLNPGPGAYHSESSNDRIICHDGVRKAPGGR